MTIETKFNLEDYVYLLVDGKIARGTVSNVSVFCVTVGTFNKAEITIIYNLNGQQKQYNEKVLFESPESLSKSLTEEYNKNNA